MRTKTNWAVMILIALGTLLILFPLYMTLTIALKNPEEMTRSVFAIPTTFHWENFSNAVKMTNFFRAFRNSALVTISTVVLTLLTNSLVAYAIARNMHRKFFKGLYFYFISAMFIPFPIIMLPIVKLASALHMTNLVGLTILHTVYALAFNVFVYVGYIRSIPTALEEAATVDGATTWGTFWRIIFPLMAPINATVGILICLSTYNDFLLPLIIISDQSSYTLPLVQYIFQGQFNTDYNLAFASYLMAMLPMIIIYLFAQKWIINGVTQGAVK
ncbi:carbohydrate ABC transporter permease [Paenibacillus cellulositrophicus]|uniref:Raffinose/stachyose/melibiose transport system permease protein n=1 Tax=Paenibacillus favisporus TaxID=221028 RepID=A0ABV2F851_9BACL|nr:MULTISPECIES: carbohydrate ABC transporter permease [Paenibacillus]MBJ9991913.1 carbohydrate ABC transporter permease [Paenibacillus sp. S28]MCM3000884.1 carbohydrate ABC transporter permease [Paenibacillus cellulositrophicus]OXL86899.1 ABC transporter permease [Paenibacillus sp. SSG-1]PQP86588.1 carbohydrate ABC transporter permease [Paenibacillus sp. AR247]UYO05353.1 carbohydrate ABC transporter permease [Paenibacillus sp. PSB04]